MQNGKMQHVQLFNAKLQLIDAITLWERCVCFGPSNNVVVIGGQGVHDGGNITILGKHNTNNCATGSSWSQKSAHPFSK